MAEPLTHQPFMSLNADKVNVTPIRPGVHRRTPKDKPMPASKVMRLLGVEPDREHVDKTATLVSAPRAAPLPKPEPPAREPEPVAAKKKKKRSPEAIAKFKATLAAKRAAGWTPGRRRGKTSARSPESIAKQRATLARKKRQSANGPSPEGASISDLLQAIVDATIEIQRRLSQLTL